MRVREHDGVDGLRIDRKRLPVPLAQLLQSLEQAAVDEDALSTRLEQMFRSGDGARGAEKRERRHPRIISDVLADLDLDNSVTNGDKRRSASDPATRSLNQRPSKDYLLRDKIPLLPVGPPARRGDPAMDEKKMSEDVPQSASRRN